MTPKEKAIEFVFELADMFDPLIVKYDSGEIKGAYPDIEKAKRFALVCVEEILQSLKTAYQSQYIEVGSVFKEYWQSVKEEINKL